MESEAVRRKGEHGAVPFFFFDCLSKESMFITKIDQARDTQTLTLTLTPIPASPVLSFVRHVCLLRNTCVDFCFFFRTGMGGYVALSWLKFYLGSQEVKGPSTPSGPAYTPLCEAVAFFHGNVVECSARSLYV